MKPTWEVKTLGDLIRLEYGKPLDPVDRNSAGRYAAYGANGEKVRTDKFYCEGRTIVVGRKGSAGQLTMTEEKFWPLDVAYFVEFDRQRHDLKFLYYLLTTLDLPSLATGVKPGINRNAVYSLPARVPLLPEQRRIVTILDEAFEGIATAQANAKKNLQNARAVLESHLRRVFDDIRVQWPTSSLSDLCALFVDSAHRTPKYQPEGIPALRPRDVVNGILDLSRVARVSPEEYEIQSKRHKPLPGDIVYSRELSFGWAALLPESPAVCLSQGMCVFRPKPDLAPDYLLYVLNGPVGREQAIRAAVGTAHPHINLGDIRAYQIPLPPLDQQRRATRQLDALTMGVDSVAELIAKKLTALDELKKSLLHQAFSGAMTSTVADKKLEAVA